MTNSEKKLLKKIEELEARIKVLEARPLGETHHHYHYPQQPVVAPTVVPSVWPTVWCGDIQMTPTLP
jgi:hypothetical protein